MSPAETNAIRSAFAHWTANAMAVVSPIVTVTTRRLAPLTAQLLERPESARLWLPPRTLKMVTVPFTGTAGPAAPSTLTLYPSGAPSTPAVLVVMRRVPVVAVQPTSKATCAVAPAATSTERGLVAPGTQFGATSASRTVWVPAFRPETVTELFTETWSPVAPSTLTV